MIVNSKGKKVTDPKKIAKLFNDHYANVGPNIDKKIPNHLKSLMITSGTYNKTYP